MPSYMTLPQFQLTLGSQTYTNDQAWQIEITRLENGFDTATIMANDFSSYIYPNIATAGTSCSVGIKDYADAAFTTVFSGIVRFPILPLAESEIIRLKCDGAGYGFGDTVCAQEYGSQSKNPTLDTLLEILTDSTYGVVPKHVNKILGSATDSGFSYDTTNVATITGTIPFLSFPYKPNNKVLDDICDLVTAIKAGSAGPHWIVDTDSKLRVKLIDGTQTGWTKYYGDSQANATLVQDVDFQRFQFEKMGPEANHIVYAGLLRKPSQDIWCENNAASWYSDTAGTPDNWNSYKVIGDYCIRISKGISATITVSYPSGRSAGWNLQNLGSLKNPPIVAFYARKNDNFNYIKLRLETTTGTDYYEVDINPKLASTNTWYHFSYPIGPYYANNLKDDEMFTWTVAGSPSWSNINCVTFVSDHTGSCSYFLDDLHFEGLLIRIAKNSTSITSNKLKTRVITDRIGKDDSLVASDDSGGMAQLAYCELLRLQKTSLVGTVTVPMIKDILPGQWVHTHAKKTASGSFNVNTDMRITKIVHDISTQTFQTTLDVTDDVTNAHPRSAYESVNKVWASMRPEFQDRQASSIKAGDIDILITPLEKDYPS